MALNNDWREFLELLNSRGVDYVIVGAQSLAFQGVHVSPDTSETSERSAGHRISRTSPRSRHNVSMPHRETAKPFIFFFLVLPYGISSGFVSITLPFVLTRAGFSVATAASIVAIGVSANLWRFLWGLVNPGLALV